MIQYLNWTIYEQLIIRTHKPLEAAVIREKTHNRMTLSKKARVS